MKLSTLGEFGLIDRIRKQFRAGSQKSILQGIGDDTAVIQILPQGSCNNIDIKCGGGVNPKSEIRTRNNYILLTTDTLVEKVHFNLKYTSFYDIGWKLIASNLSDIASMGGTPKYALITLGLRKGMKISEIDSFYGGIKALARKFKINIIGGDIVSSPKAFFFTMNAYGEAGKVVRRSGAKNGDNIYYIGPLGYSAVGLNILKKNKRIAGANKFIKAHLNPVPLVKEGRKIAKIASSMIDNSDGLARCLIEICKASKVGAEVEMSEIVSNNLKKTVKKLKLNPMKLSLHGGEDYGLLFTSKRSFKMPKVRRIGRITDKKGIYLLDNGTKIKLSESGYQHF